MQLRGRLAGGLSGLTLAFCLQSGATAAESQTARTFPAYPREAAAGHDIVTVAVDGSAGSRTFRFETTAPQRENAPQTRLVEEAPGSPVLQSGNLLFDGLFALTLDDARLISVDQISDEAYNGGLPIDCRCFQTGEKWPYVWTRDLAYALDLGMAGLDPERGAMGLLFKTSGFRADAPVPPELPPGTLQIVQDTGSGGSWPISTDRTTWAIGAERTLAYLDGDTRDDFARHAFLALQGTVEADRVAAFDALSGLYGGEHSFLDWREQTYAPWVTNDLTAMAESKALSTNIAQYRALRLASRLARDSAQPEAARRYAAWAEALAEAIDRGFWDEAAGLYVTYTSADPTPAPIRKYDLLGNALAVVSGLADEKRAQTILSRYPFAPYGPPVVWPQAPDEFVYHNRAQWPFVTAYALRAAAQAGAVDAADRSLEALIRGAALHLSNMENLEWLTGRSEFDDGPQINSRRQLWSVGAYYGAVTSTLFGWQAGMDGAQVSPFLTTRMRRLFSESGEIALTGLKFHGRTVDIRLELPPQAEDGMVYAVAALSLNGREFDGALTPEALSEDLNTIRVRFGEPRRSGSPVTLAPEVDPLSHDDPKTFMPVTPVIQTVERSGNGVDIRVAEAVTPEPLVFSVYRNGELQAGDVSGPGWRDVQPLSPALTACYSVTATFSRSGLSSQPSRPVCLDGQASQTFPASRLRVTGSGESQAGSPAVRLSAGNEAVLDDVTIQEAGRYAISVEYDNRAYTVNTGVTNAVKRLEMRREDGETFSGVVQMPHVRDADGLAPTRRSTRVYLDLPAGRYQLRLSDFMNMSSLQSNAAYGGPGGSAGHMNEAEIATVRLDRVR